MGMFKDMKDAFGVVRSDELKELKKKADAQPKTSMMDGIKMANQAMDQAAGMQQAYGSGSDMQRLMTGPTTSGQALIDSLAETGQVVNGSPLMQFELTVSVTGREPYKVTHQQVISPAVLHNFQAGKTMPVKIDPQDPGKLYFG
jgi:hypothetical protein